MGVRCGFSWKEVNALSDSDEVVVDVLTTMDKNSCGDDSYTKIAAWDSEGNRAEDTSKHFGGGYLWVCARKKSFGSVKEDLKAGRNGQVVTGLVASDGWWGSPWEYLGKWDNHDWRDAYAFAYHTGSGETEVKTTRHYIMIFQEKQEPALPKVVTVIAGWDFYHQTRGAVPIMVKESYTMNVGGKDEKDEATTNKWAHSVTNAFKFGIGYGGASIGFSRSSTKSESFQHSLKETCVRTFQQNSNVAYQYTIPAAVAGEPRFSNFWYWKVSAQEGDTAI